MLNNLIKIVTWLIVIFTASFLARWFRPKKHSAVIGEIIGGLIIGNLTLLGISLFAHMRDSGFLNFLSQLGISLLLFQIGFELTVGHMRKVSARSLSVATVGVLATFLLVYFFSPKLIPGLESVKYIFIAAALTATSVGITARILKDLGCLDTQETTIILGAAAIDDVISLLALSFIMAVFQTGRVEIAKLGLLFIKTALFIAVGITIGQMSGRFLPQMLYQIYPRVGTKIFVAFSFFALFALISMAVGLSPIVGSFIGGLVLDQKYFEDKDDERFSSVIGDEDIEGDTHGNQVRSTIGHAGRILVPVFFVMTGVRMDLSPLFTIHTLIIAAGLVSLALVGKLICGLATGEKVNRWLVGFGMVPRGEVELIFANIGLSLGILTPTIFSAIVIVVMVTTIMTPFILTSLLSRSEIRL